MTDEIATAAIHFYKKILRYKDMSLFIPPKYVEIIDKSYPEGGKEWTKELL